MAALLVLCATVFCLAARCADGGPAVARSGTFAKAANRPRELPTLTTARAAHQLTTQEAARAYPVRIRAMVTYYDHDIDPRRPIMFITDATGSIFVVTESKLAMDLKAGQIVEVTGVTGAGDFAPIVEHALIRVVGEGHLPASAPRTSMSDLLTGVADGAWVEIEGVVHAVRERRNNVFLDIVMRDGKITAATVKEHGADYARLVDAQVRLRGNQAPLFNHQGQMTGAQMLFPNLSTLQVEQPGASDPFALPVGRVRDLLRYAPNAIFVHRVHIRGRVTLLWPGRLLCLEDGPQGLCAQTDQQAGTGGLKSGAAGDLATGMEADVIGFPVIGPFTPTLVNASYRAAVPEGGGGRPVPATAVTASEALKGSHDATVVEIEAKLLGVDKTATDPAILMSSENFVFSAVLPARKRTGDPLPGNSQPGPPLPSEPLSPWPALQEGSVLKIQGVCMQQSDGTLTTDFPVAKSFRILLRSPADIVVVRRPSWWNTAHTLRVLALALALTLATLFLVAILGQRVRQQSRTIRESEERFRELATRDGLTQLPNRNAILATLEASLDKSLAQGTHVCVAILDLDHFKQVNDKFGHLGGDEVLQQTAQRLSLAVRSNDAVGRLGGEEFLIVFSGADRKLGTESCERIRRAICCEPVVFGTQAVCVSCSIGVASARGGTTGVMTLIAEADSALYRAKAGGRNRVECFLPEYETAQLPF